MTVYHSLGISPALGKVWAIANLIELLTLLILDNSMFFRQTTISDSLKDCAVCAAQFYDTSIDSPHTAHPRVYYFQKRNGTLHDWLTNIHGKNSL